MSEAIVQEPVNILRIRAVKACTGLGATTIYELMAKGEFPLPVRLSPRCVGWLENEVVTWQNNRIAERAAEAKSKAAAKLKAARRPAQERMSA